MRQPTAPGAPVAAGVLERGAATVLLEDRARNMRRMTYAPDWHKAADTLDL